MLETLNILSQVYSAEIENDNNDEGKDSLVSDIQEANDILAYFKNEYGEIDNGDKYKTMLKEHNELNDKIKKAVLNDRFITKTELNKIKIELSEINDLESSFDKIDRLSTNLFNNTKENRNYANTLLRIEWSKSNEKTENIIHGIITESQQFLNGAKKTDFFDEISEAYINLEDYINDSLDKDKKFDFEEMNQIQKLYGELLTLTDQHGIEKKGLTISKNRLEKHKIIENETRLKGKNIDDNWSESELKQALKITQKNYLNYNGSDSFESIDNIFEIDSKKDAREFQDKLIEKLLGPDKGFDNSYIQGFRTEDGGNIIISISEFETEIKGNDIQSLNRLGLVSYFKKINSDQMFNVLSEKFGIKKATDLMLLTTEKGDFKKMFDDKNQSGLLDNILKSATNFIDNIFSGNFIETFQNSTDREGLLLLLKNPTEEQRITLKKSLGYHLKLNEKEAEELMNKLKNAAEDQILVLLKINGATEKNINILTTNVINLQVSEKKYIFTQLYEKKQKGLLTIEEKYIFENIPNNIQNLNDFSTVIGVLSPEQLMQVTENIQNGGTFEENIEILRVENSRLDQLLKKQELEKRERIVNKITQINDRKENSVEYSNENYYIDTTDSENNFIISKNSSEKIKITPEEADLVQDNPKALKNLIDTNEKLDILGLDFVWKYRAEFINTMQNTDEFKLMKMDINDNFISPDEFNNLLRYILTLLGEKPSNSPSGNVSKILNISKVSSIDDKKNSRTKYGNIGTMFNEMGYIGASSIDTGNKIKMQNYKQTLQNYNQKK